MLILLVAILLIGVAAALGLRAFAFPKIAASQRLAEIGAYGFAGPVTEAEHVKTPLRVRFDALALRLGARLDRRITREREQELRRQLSAAGLYRMTPVKFVGYRALATAALVLFWTWVIAVGNVNALTAMFGFACVAAAGWVFPSFWLKRRAAGRLKQIDHEMPELVDLLRTAVEGGLGFGSSLQVAVRSLTGPLGDELRLTLQEQSMGLSTIEALNNMLDRVDTFSVRTFVQAIAQGETLGVSVGKILRDLAKEMRSRRRQAAEERAHKAGTKIIFPVAVCIFPAIFVVALGPMVIYLSHSIGIGR